MPLGSTEKRKNVLSVYTSVILYYILYYVSFYYVLYHAIFYIFCIILYSQRESAVTSAPAAELFSLQLLYVAWFTDSRARIMNLRAQFINCARRFLH